MGTRDTARGGHRAELPLHPALEGSAMASALRPGLVE